MSCHGSGRPVLPPVEVPRAGHRSCSVPSAHGRCPACSSKSSANHLRMEEMRRTAPSFAILIPALLIRIPPSEYGSGNSGSGRPPRWKDRCHDPNRSSPHRRGTPGTNRQGNQRRPAPPWRRRPGRGVRACRSAGFRRTARGSPPPSQWSNRHRSAGRGPAPRQGS